MTEDVKTSPRRTAYLRVRLRKIKDEIEHCRGNLTRMRAGEPGDGDPRAYYFERLNELKTEREALRAELGESAPQATEAVPE